MFKVEENFDIPECYNLDVMVVGRQEIRVIIGDERTQVSNYRRSSRLEWEEWTDPWRP